MRAAERHASTSLSKDEECEVVRQAHHERGEALTTKGSGFSTSGKGFSTNGLGSSVTRCAYSPLP